MKAIGCAFLNKQNGVLEKVLDNQELIECIKGDPIVYVCSNKDFEIAWTKKNAWKEISSVLRIRYFISASKV